MVATEERLTSWDGTELFYRAWLPRPGLRKALLLFHRGHEHGGRWQETVDALGLEDVAVFAWDARGHGKSPGERGAAASLNDLIKDVDAFVMQIATKHGIALENMILLAHSLAAVTVTAWVHDYAPPIRALILATAAFRVRLYIPLAIPALRLQQKFFRGGRVQSYVRAKMLTHDSIEAASYEADPLIFRQIAINLLLDLHDTGQRLLADAGAILTPTLMIGAGRDFVVSLKAQRQFFERLSSPDKELQVFPAAYHALFHERERSEVVGRVREFVRAKFAQPRMMVSLRQADRSGYTWEEFERLKQRGGSQFMAARVALRTAGRLSKGIDLGWRSGFDSGLSLDYVYENRPQGRSGLGKLIDANYLNAIGWRGIRERKLNLKKALRETIERVASEDRPVRLLDVAAGPGRYLMETMLELKSIPMSALLRDNRSENITAARALAMGFGLENVRAELGDAFDHESLGVITPRPTIALVSGLYELFPGNDAVLKSLGGIAAALEPGSYLIYTNQPWHPQVEFIARVLHNREGKPWIMRRRTSAEMDELVRLAGFEKLKMEVDRWGMFTVSVARRSFA
jgi:alpha-beta hydrolase superfamily lysophospholipase